MTKKGYLLVAIATLLTIILWVFFDIIHKRSEVKTSADIEKLVEPIDSNFNLDGI